MASNVSNNKGGYPSTPVIGDTKLLHYAEENPRHLTPPSRPTLDVLDAVYVPMSTSVPAAVLLLQIS